MPPWVVSIVAREDAPGREPGCPGRGSPTTERLAISFAKFPPINLKSKSTSAIRSKRGMCG